MTFEIGTLGSTKWTSTVPTPFGPAPGAGLGDGVQRRPRRAATTDYESGFAADPVTTEYTFSKASIAQGLDKSYVAKTQPVAQGQIPAALVQLYFTDRGTATKTLLDRGVFDVMRSAGFQVSRTTKFDPLLVQWKKQNIPGTDFFRAVVASPASIAGMMYGGSALGDEQIATDATMVNLPNSIYVYTFAVTTAKDTFTDAEGAKLLTLLKQTLGRVLPASGGYAAKHVTLMGAAPDVFIGPKPAPTPDPTPGPTPGPSPIVVAGISSILLIAAYNMLSPHIGSEREARFRAGRAGM
jgi:hypothetical protein